MASEPIDPLSDPCACSALRRASRHLSRLYDQQLAAVGLTVGQFSILRTLGGDARSFAIGALADETVMDRTTLTRALQPLVREGLATISPDPDDARSRIVEITAPGRKRLGDGIVEWRKAQEEFARQFGRNQMAALREMTDVVQSLDWNQ